MNILALVTDAYGGYGGIAQYNRDLLDALAASPQVRQVRVLPRRGRAAAASAKISAGPPRPSRAIYSAQALAEAARQRFDCVFCGHLYHLPLAAWLGRLSGAPLWLQAHGVEAWSPPSHTLRRAAGRAALVTCVSRFTRRRLLSWAPVAPARARVLPNCVRPIFTPGPRDERLLRAHDLAGARVILSVSRLARADAYKGQARVIDAMPAILAAEPRARFVIVGDGDGRPELQRRAANLGKAVRFVGRLPDEDLLALYRSADLFLMPSLKEGFGIVFLEAAACGLPVIAGDADGSVDALADGAFGRLVDPDDVEGLAQAAVATLLAPRPPAHPVADRFGFPQFAAHVDALLANLRG